MPSPLDELLASARAPGSGLASSYDSSGWGSEYARSLSRGETPRDTPPRAASSVAAAAAAAAALGLGPPKKRNPSGGAVSTPGLSGAHVGGQCYEFSSSAL